MVRDAWLAVSAWVDDAWDGLVASMTAIGTSAAWVQWGLAMLAAAVLLAAVAVSAPGRG